MNIATAWEAVAAAIPDEDALIHGDVVRSWRDLDSIASRVAGHLVAAGLGPGSKVALYLHNCTEYLEATFGAFKARCVPVNVNYRYLDAELLHLLENSDAEAVVVSADLVDRLGAVRDRLPLLRTVLVVGADAEHPVPDWTGSDGGGLAAAYDDAVTAAAPMERIERSPDDLWFLYTGGTTGMPKGVMWPHRSIIGTSESTFRVIRSAIPSDPEGFGAAARTFHERGKAVRLLAAAPLMHGTSGLSANGVLLAGGCVVTLTSRSFDAHELCAVVQDRRVTQLTIVGDAFAKPILEVLAEARDAGTPYDLSSLKVIVSSGVIWSQPVKDELHRWSDAILADLLGSSEGTGFGTSVSRRGRGSADGVGTAESRPGTGTGEGAGPRTAAFQLGENARVFTEDGREVEPGSGEVGVLAVGGPIPIGYYKDPEKTATTFRTFRGRVWSVPGDFATVEADGSIRLLGRGSVCINTAGEKVYPEEVEEALKLHPAVRDANVVGLADEKWGQAVTGVVQLADGTVDSPELHAAIIASTKEHLAGYKCPKRIVVVERIQRGPNGKADYRWATSTAEATLG